MSSAATIGNRNNIRALALCFVLLVPFFAGALTLTEEVNSLLLQLEALEAEIVQSERDAPYSLTKAELLRVYQSIGELLSALTVQFPAFAEAESASQTRSRSTSGTSLTGTLPALGQISASAAGAADNERVLCLFNSESALSRNICDYYREKRPGARLLGVKTSAAEEISGPAFLTQVVRPLYAYLDAHPEWTITHLAVAKGIPIRVTDTEAYLYRGNDFMDLLPGTMTPRGKRVIASSNFLLSMEGNYATADNLSEYLLGPAIASDRGCIGLKPSFKSSRNLGYQNAPAQPFDPDEWRSPRYATNPRFAVSFLTGYAFSDIQKMLDKAVAPAASKLQAAWVSDIDPNIGILNDADRMANVRNNLQKAGVQPDAVFGYSAAGGEGGVKEYPRPIIGYFGMGIYNPGYDARWVAARPAIRSAVAPRAILISLESWNGFTFEGDASHEGQARGDQGKIADAFAPSAFGGSGYSNSFSGAVGNAYEPTNVGTVHQAALFGNYAAGLTFGESVLKSFRYLPESVYSVHIAVGDPLMRAFSAPNQVRSIAPFQYSEHINNDEIQTTGGRGCYNQPRSCTAPDGAEIADGESFCADGARSRMCVNGTFSAATACEKGCSLGACVEDVFSPPKTLTLQKGKTYSLVAPVKTGSGKLSALFPQPPFITEVWGIPSFYGRTGKTFYLPTLGWWPDLEIEPGTGFFIKPGEDYEIELAGALFTSSAAVPIKGPQASFGIPFCGEKYSASDALREIRSIEPRCKRIFNEAIAARTSPSLYWGDEDSGTSAARRDFKLNNHEAYLLVCEPSVNFIWKPSCDPAGETAAGNGEGDPRAKARNLLRLLSDFETRIGGLPR